ncbi:Rib/alpha-like domain-containing protein, partial [Lactobacillus mulieris]
MKSMFDERQRFSLRKLTIGVVSVLLGVTFVNNVQEVKADTTPDSTQVSSQSKAPTNSAQVQSANQESTQKQSTSTNQNNSVTNPIINNTNNNSNITDNSQSAQSYVTNTRQSTMQDFSSTNVDHSKGYNYLYDNPHENPGVIFAGGPQNWGFASDANQNFKVTKEAQTDGTTKWTVTFLPDCQTIFRSNQNHPDNGSFAFFLSKDYDIIKDKNGSYFKVYEAITNGSRTYKKTHGGFQVIKDETLDNFNKAGTYGPYSPYISKFWEGKTRVWNQWYSANFAREIRIFLKDSTPEERSKLLNDLSLYMDSYGIANWHYYNNVNTGYDLQTGIGPNLNGDGSSHLQKAFRMDANNANKNPDKNMWGNTNPVIDVNDFGSGFFFRSQDWSAIDDAHGGTLTVTFYTRPSNDKVSTYSGLVALQNEGTPQNPDGGAARSHEATTNTRINHAQADSTGVSDGRIVTANTKDAATGVVDVVVENNSGYTESIPNVSYTLTKSSLSDITGNKDSAVSSVSDTASLNDRQTSKKYYISESFNYSDNTEDMQDKLNQALNPNSSSGSKYLKLSIDNLTALEKAGLKATTSYDSANKQYIITIAKADTDNLKYPAIAPAALTVVNDKADLSKDVSATNKISALLKAANSEVESISYDDTNQKVILTYQDKTTNTISYDDVAVQVPQKTMIFQDPGANTFTITDNRAGEISDAVSEANSTANLGIKVNQTNGGYDGSVTVTRTSSDGNVKQTATLTPAQTIINIPNPVVVHDINNITDNEKQKVVDNLKSVNKTIADSFNKDKVFVDGTAQVPFSDGSATIVIPGKYTVVQSVHTKITLPSGLVWVKDESNLTNNELNQIKKLYKEANDGATNVEFGPNGVGLTITYSDGTSDTLTDVRANQSAINYPKRVLIPVGKTPVDSEYKTAYQDAFEDSRATKSNIDQIDYTESITVHKNGDVDYNIVYIDPTTQKTMPYYSGSLNNVYTTVRVKNLVKVANPAQLTDKDKQAIETELTNDNPGVAFDWNKSNFVNGYSGNSTLAFSQGSATLNVKNSDLIYSEVVAPTKKTAVGNPDKLTDEQKQEIIQNVIKANSNLGVTSAVIDQNNGNVVVTYDGSGISQTLPISDTIVKIPVRTLVANKANDWINPDYTLDSQEKAAVKAAVEALNPGYSANVADDGSVVLQDVNGDTANLTSDQAILRLPKRTVVKDKTQLTSDEKATVLAAIKKLNPLVSTTDANDAIADDGSATLAFNDNGPKLRNISGDLLVYQDAKLNKPTTLAPVVDKKNLTSDEIATIIQNVKDANKAGSTTYLSNVNVVKDAQGNNVVQATLPNGKTATLSMDEVAVTIPLRTVVKNKGPYDNPIFTLSNDEIAKEKAAFMKANPNIDSNAVTVHRSGNITVYGADGSDLAKISNDKTTFDILNKVPVKNQKQLDKAEQTSVESIVSLGNKHVDMSKTHVGIDGTASDMAKISFNDGTHSITVSGTDLTSQIVNDVVYPFNITSKTLVNNPGQLTDAEKRNIQNKISDDNPEVGNVNFTTDKNGNKVVELIYPDGTKTIIPLSAVVAKYPDKTQIKLSQRNNNPTEALTSTQKAAVAANVKASNPDAKIIVNSDGSVEMTESITYQQPIVKAGQENNPDAPVVYKTETKEVTTQITAPDTVINVPDQVPVTDPNNLTDLEKQQVFNAIVAANPNVKFNDADPISSIIAANGDANLTYQDGTPKVKLTNLVKQRKIADSQILNVPDEKVFVKNKNKLTSDETQGVKNAVAEANRYAGQDPDVEIANDGTITVTYSDKSSLTLPVKESSLTVQYPDRQIIQNDTPVDSSALKADFLKVNPDLADQADQIQVNENGDIEYPGSDDTDPAIYMPHTLTTIKVGPKVLVDDVKHLTNEDKAKVTQLVENDNKDQLNNNQDNFNPISDQSYQEDGLHITYPEGQGQDVVIPYSDLVYSNKPQTDPVAQPIVVKTGDSITPDEGIENKGSLDKPSYSWRDGKAPKTSEPGKYTGTVEVTQDGKNPEDVTVPVYVVSAGKPIAVSQNHKLDGNDAKSTISADSDLPGNSTYSWKVAPDTSTPGDNKDGVVTVTVGSQAIDVPVKVNVKAISPQVVAPVAQPIVVSQGDIPNPEDGIANKDDLNNPSYAWKDNNAPSTKEVGKYTGVVVVTQDGQNTQEVPVTVHVVGAGAPITVEQGHKLDETDAKKALDTKSDLPTDTDYSWSKEPDTTTSGNNKSGAIIVTIPGEGSVEIPVKVNVKPNASSQVVTPIAQPVVVKPGAEVKPEDGIENKPELNNPSYSWRDSKNPDTTTPGKHTGVVVVTQDGQNTQEVPVTVHVVEAGDPITVVQGHKLDDTDAKKTIDTKSNLPEGTTYSWKAVPDTSTPGNGKDGVVTVTIPNEGSIDIPVKVNVSKSSETPEFVKPIGKNITKQVGEAVEPKDGIDNVAKLPLGTTYSWKDGKGPDMSKPGTYNETVEVTEPGSKPIEVSITVVVSPKSEATPSQRDSDKYTAKGQDIVVKQGQEPSAEDGIGNKDKLPSGTTYSWKDGTPDTSTLGDKTGTVEVTYPDGSKAEVKVTVHVTEPTKQPTQADENTPEPKEISVRKGENPKAEDGIGNKDKLPSGTTYSWKDGTPDTSTSGDKTGTVEVTYPDGSKAEVKVT